MSNIIDEAVASLREKMADVNLGGSVKFVVEDEGEIMMDADGIRVADEEADVTLRASADVFRDIFDGEKSPTAAFMTGKLKIDGNMGLAMKLASAL